MRGCFSVALCSELTYHAFTDRLEAFTSLQSLASAPRLAPGDYGEVARLIKKTVAMDSNVAVIGAAIDATAALAKGLRRDFRGEARMLTPHLLDKFKDKTTNVIRAIHAALTAFHDHCYALLGAMRSDACMVRYAMCSDARRFILTPDRRR